MSPSTEETKMSQIDIAKNASLLRVIDELMDTPNRTNDEETVYRLACIERAIILQRNVD